MRKNSARIVIVSGQGESGKDTFCSLCGRYCAASMYSSIDKIKEAAKVLGWDGQKDEKSRKFLSNLKDLSTEYNDFPMQAMKNYVEMWQYYDQLILLQVREPDQIERAKKEFDAITLLVKKNDAAPITGNRADRDVDKFDYDYTVYNSGTLDDLAKTAEEFCKLVFSGHFDEDDE